MASRRSFDDHRLNPDEIDWFPPSRDRQPSTAAAAETLVETLRVPTASASSQPLSMRSSSPGLPDSVFAVSDDHEMEPRRNTIIVIPNHEKDRTVNRRLRGIHVFMITISGVLGVGLYIRSGTVLRVGGPGAVLIAFTVMGLLAWMVMQCIGEFLALWPISGALVEYVAKFVDEDLGTAVGIAYWFTYSINFAALIVAAAGVLEIWNPAKAFQGTIMFFVVPLFLVLLNSFGVQIYGLTEVVGGSLKILGIFIVIVCMIAINVGAGAGEYIGTRNYRDHSMFRSDDRVVDNWASALLHAFSIAAFAYVGVDITAATALEARPDQKRTLPRDLTPDRPKGPWPYISIRFVATWTSFLTWIIYFIAGFLMSLNVSWDEDSLQEMSSVGSSAGKRHEGEVEEYRTDSRFVISAAMSRIPGLADMVTAIIFITAVFSANTNLYVASRTIFGLTRRLPDTSWRVFAFFGKTNNYQVPVRAMLLSCFFMWVPFLYLSPEDSPGTTISSLLEVLSQMGSVSCIIVWACECWAFIRFYNCMHRHKNALSSSSEFKRLRRFPTHGVEDHYPWRSHGQPVTMYLALFGCLFVLIVADGTALWHNWDTPRFLSAYLSVLCFGPLYLGIKIYNNWGNVQWKLEDLEHFASVEEKLKELDGIYHHATASEEDVQEKGWGNLWGLM
ncbi:amino acid permease-domain-containing protein [Aspergillus egyptiacus]|nr:amino acid permease-domain-containing protein [Aspergillus egyptiacus]